MDTSSKQEMVGQYISHLKLDHEEQVHKLEQAVGQLLAKVKEAESATRETTLPPTP